MKNVIKIDRLNIRLKGISSQTAQLAVNGLGSELLHQLARHRVLSPQEQAGTDKINTIDAGAFTMPTNGNTNASVLQRKIAAGIVDAVSAKVTHLHKKRSATAPSCTALGACDVGDSVSKACSSYMLFYDISKKGVK